MNKLMINSLLEIFAVMVNRKNVFIHQLAINYVEIYFHRIVDSKTARQKKEEFALLINQIKKKQNSININRTCRVINNELSKSQRIILLINLIEFIEFISKNELKEPGNDHPLYSFIENISGRINISSNTLQDCKNFVADQYYLISDQAMLVYAKENDLGLTKNKYIHIPTIKGFLAFFYIKEAQLVLFKYNGSSILELNSRLIFPKNIYIFQSGSVISAGKIPLIFYNQIVRLVKLKDFDADITLELHNVNYSHKGSTFGVKNINFGCTSGELVGIIGGSGSGKTTLLNIINGNFKPDSGSLSLNGAGYSNSISSIQKHIGFVPQDDSLIGELTVYENLYFTTALSKGNLPKQEIKSTVENYLSEFALFHIRNQKVGLPIQRYISGGQRKRLNIVSELVRESNLLLVDEPTSGLSSMDSYKTVVLLKEQTSRGKLVIMNIHQPSADIYRLFDKILVLDEGGYMVYYGNPVEALGYFMDKSQNIDAAIECPACHTLKPDAIFEIIEDKVVDETGMVTDVRKRKAEEWSKLYSNSSSQSKTSGETRPGLPLTKTIPPSKNRQLFTFIERLTASKVRDREFVLFSFAVPTLLAFILSMYSRYSILTGKGVYEYIYYENDNIPIYFLMSIISCMFSGVITSADCVIKDGLLRKREKFLFLNNLSYINSKIIFFAAVSAIQTVIFMFVSAIVLKIPGSLLHFWILLFTMSLLGNILGIIISSLIKSAAAAYIIIPFIIIPQITFSGLAIPYEKLNRLNYSNKNIPFIGNITLARWGIEALLVMQFKENDYEKPIFELDCAESQTRAKAYFFIPKLTDMIKECSSSKQNATTSSHYTIISNELPKLGINLKVEKDELRFNKRKSEQLINLLSTAKEGLMKKHSSILRKRDSILREQSLQLEPYNQLITLKNEQTNNKINQLVLNRGASTILEITNNSIIQKIDPIFSEPRRGLFNSPFFSSSKNIMGYTVDTYSVNMSVMLIIYILLYIFLLVLFRFIRK